MTEHIHTTLRPGNGRPHAGTEPCPYCGQEMTNKLARESKAKFDAAARAEAEKQRKEIEANARKDAEANFKKQTRERDEKFADMTEKFADMTKELAEERRQRKEAQTLVVNNEANQKGAIAKHVAEERKNGDRRVAVKDKEIELINGRNSKHVRNLENEIRDLKRQSPNERGKSAHKDLHAALKTVFTPPDRIEDVPTGKPGADVIQTVRNDDGRECGKILLESKDTKECPRKFITKLHDDKIDAGADFAILSTVNLPSFLSDAQPVHVVDGMIIVKPEHVVTVVAGIREVMKQIPAASRPDQRERINARLLDLLTSERAQLALRSVPESIDKLRRFNKKFMSDHELVYAAMLHAFGWLSAEIDHILKAASGE
jgi:hypothetical protein